MRRQWIQIAVHLLEGDLIIQLVLHPAMNWYILLKPLAIVAMVIFMYLGAFSICVTNIMGLPGAAYGLITSYAFIRMIRDKEKDLEFVSQRMPI